MDKFEQFLGTLDSTPMVEAVRNGYRVIMEASRWTGRPDTRDRALKAVGTDYNTIEADPVMYTDSNTTPVAAVAKSAMSDEGYDISSPDAAFHQDVLNDNKGVDGGLVSNAKEYRTLNVEGRTWMMDDLKADTYQSSKGVNGNLYTNDAIKYAIPHGWRLPTDSDWKSLGDSVIESATDTVTGEEVPFSHFRVLGFMPGDRGVHMENGGRLVSDGSRYRFYWCAYRGGQGKKEIDGPAVCRIDWTGHVEFFPAKPGASYAIRCVR